MAASRQQLLDALAALVQALTNEERLAAFVKSASGEGYTDRFKPDPYTELFEYYPELEAAGELLDAEAEPTERGTE